MKEKKKRRRTLRRKENQNYSYTVTELEWLQISTWILRCLQNLCDLAIVICDLVNNNYIYIN